MIFVGHAMHAVILSTVNNKKDPEVPHFLRFFLDPKRGSEIFATRDTRTRYHPSAHQHLTPPDEHHLCHLQWQIPTMLPSLAPLDL